MDMNRQAINCRAENANKGENTQILNTVNYSIYMIILRK